MISFFRLICLNKIAILHRNLAGEWCVVHGEFSDLRCLMKPLIIIIIIIIIIIKVKLPRGNIYGYLQNNKRIPHDSSWGKFYGLMRNQSCSANQDKVKCRLAISRNHVFFMCWVCRSLSSIENAAGLRALLWMLLRLINRPL